MALLTLLLGAARGEVKSSSENDFAVSVTVRVDAPPGVAYQKFLQIKNWWQSTHTFSLNAKNLYIEAKPKGWWGEKLPNGGFAKHMEVIYVVPGKVLRFRGGLGPLQALPVNGAMQVMFVPKGKGTEIDLLYAVGGFVNGGVKRMGVPVERVLKVQLNRLKQFIDKPKTSKKAAGK